IEADAQKTRSSQLNKNLLIGERAEADTKPELEIHADDVKASHGATVGQLSENEIFYLMSRGISREVAMEMLAEGFVQDVLFQFGNKDIEDMLSPYLRKRSAELTARSTEGQAGEGQ